MKLMKMFKCRVRLSADLEVRVASMGPGQRREMAHMFRQYAHQLEFSAMIMELDQRPKPPPKLKWLPPHKLKRN